MNGKILTGAAAILAIIVLINILYKTFKILLPRKFSEQEISCVMQVMSVIATINSLLLAFVAVSVWDSYKAADISAMNEASAVALLARDLSYYGSEEALKARSSVKEYARCSIEKDWPLMANGSSSPQCLDVLEKTFNLISKIKPLSARDEVLLSSIWEKANDMSGARRERLQAARSVVPKSLWLVAIIGSVITVSMLFVIQKSKLAHALISTMSCAFALVFYFIIAMQKPYDGPDAIKPVGFHRVINNMEKWDSENINLIKADGGIRIR